MTIILFTIIIIVNVLYLTQGMDAAFEISPITWDTPHLRLCLYNENSFSSEADCPTTSL